MNKEIFWNLVNAGLAGALVFLGGLTTGHMDMNTIYISLVTGIITGIIQFKDYWNKEENEYCSKKLGAFI